MKNTNSCELACSLGAAEMRTRRAEVLDVLKAHIMEQIELPDGVALRFDAARLEDVVQLIVLERTCCSFLRFRLTIEAQNGPLWLELTGPSGTKAFIQNQMGLAD